MSATGQQTRLRFLLDTPLMYGASESGVEYDENLPRYIRITDIRPDGTLDPDKAVSLTRDTAQPYLLNDGDILLARSGATVGKAFLYRSNGGEACFAGYLIRARCDQRRMIPEYLAYYLQSAGYWNFINSSALQATIQNVSAELYKEILVTHSAVDEQKSVVAYLDEQTAKIDQLMEMRRRQMALLKEQRAALIQQAVTRGLNPNAPMKDSGVPWIGRMPRDWQLLPLRGVLTERGEFNMDLRTTDFLSVIKDVGVVPYDERVATGNRKSDEMEKYKIIHPGDIVANRMNLIFGSVGLSAHFGCSSTEYYVLRGRNASVDTRFYGLIFQSKGFQRSLVGIGSGILAHRMRIYYEALKKVLLPVPPLQQQQEVVEFVEQENTRFDQLHAAYTRQLELLTEYRAALIHECVTGQRSVPELVNT